MSQPPNPRLQRTPSRAPLSRKPLGHGSRIGAVVLLGLFQIAPVVATPIASQPTPTPSAAHWPPDARDARRIAEEAFLKYTKQTVKTYSVKQAAGSPAHWEFLIQGTKKFARPGYHWLVRVNTTTGVATVVEGE